MNKNRFIRILVWLGVMAVLTLVAMGLWLAITGGDQSTVSLKWLQLLQTLGTFALPPVLCAWLWSGHHPWAWLRLDRCLSWQTVLLAVAVMLCAVPAINLLADLNSRIDLPDCLNAVEQFMRRQEEAAAALTERFLHADSLGTLLVNVGLMALLPALAEELSFRGTLQQILTDGNTPGRTTRVHLAVWLTACIFSAIHMQFYGFIPRMLMGAMFGYVFIWTGLLWAPVLMHFTNNSLAVVTYYLLGQEGDTRTWADTIGTGRMWWLGVLSLVTVGVLLCLLRKHNTCTD